MSGRQLLCRVIDDDAPHSGAWNMAVDEALLDAAVDDGVCSLRWYRWDQPTLSLGYFQKLSDVPAIPGLAALPAVRRLSGGGAIVHDQELTYSIALAADHPHAANPRALYTHIHQLVIDRLAECGVRSAFRGDPDPARESAFLCFGRGDPFDVMIGSDKILGSAQRRRKGAVLQHGSLILRHSSHAPQFRGVLDLVRDPVDVTELRTGLSDQIARFLGADLQRVPLTSGELERVRALASATEHGIAAQVREGAGPTRAGSPRFESPAGGTSRPPVAG